jgi:hypothetical protein
MAIKRRGILSISGFGKRKTIAAKKCREFVRAGIGEVSVPNEVKGNRTCHGQSKSRALKVFTGKRALSSVSSWAQTHEERTASDAIQAFSSALRREILQL